MTICQANDRIVPRLGQLASQPCQKTRKEDPPASVSARIRSPCGLLFARPKSFRAVYSTSLHLLPSCCRPFVPPSQLQRPTRELHSGPHGMLAKTPHRPATARCLGGIHTASQRRCSLFVVLVSQLLDWSFAGASLNVMSSMLIARPRVLFAFDPRTARS